MAPSVSHTHQTAAERVLFTGSLAQLAATLLPPAVPLTISSRCVRQVAEGVAAAARRRLRAALPAVPVRVEAVRDSEASGPASGLNLVAETDTGCRLGGSALGGRGVSDDQVAATAADELTQAVSAGACVDQYSQDQVLCCWRTGRATGGGRNRRTADTAVRSIRLRTVRRRVRG